VKTTFGRQFAVNAGLILLSFLILGASFVSLLFNYLLSEKRQTLASSACAIEELAAAYSTMGNLEEDVNFRMSLSFASEVSGDSALVCDPDGVVLLCSCDAIHCTHVGASLPAEIVRQVENDGSSWYTGDVEPLFDGKQYLYSIPLNAADGDQLGLVVVSTDASVLSSLLGQLSSNYILSAALVLLIALIASIFLTRSQTRSLRNMVDAVRQYGHGDFTTRIDEQKHATEEMAELTTAFNAMAESLALSEKRRTEFVANVSHELKTPMTTIGGFVDGMLDGTIPPERHRQYLQAVSDEVKRLSRLVRSMLEVSRLQAQGGVQENKKTKFDICESLGRTLLTFEQKINNKGLNVEVEFPDRDVNVLAEQDSITQVLYNLVDNAVKFCPQGGTLRLTVEPSGSRVRIAVANTGETIPEQELQLIFDRFHKTDKSRSMDKDGVGLGLYIVRTILASHNEDITVTSVDGVTTFQFQLPVAK
jgi:signal transduction histidine kinase